MEKRPILYNGCFRCHGNVRYVFPIDAFFCKVHRIGPGNMCINFEKNRLKIDNFRKSEKIMFFNVTEGRLNSVAPFCKEHVATNQKSLRLPVQKLWPIMWFLQKWLPWPLSDFNKHKFGWSLNQNTSAVKKSGRSVQYCGLYIANRQTDRPRWPIYFTKIEDFTK